MKKILLFILLFSISNTSFAQEYKKFKFMLSYGPILFTESGGEGVQLNMEPAFRITDDWSLGLKYDINLGNKDFEGNLEGFAALSLSLNTQHYFLNKPIKFRPYIGLGLGYKAQTLKFLDIGNDSPFENDAINTIFFYPRIGFDLGHFNLNIDFNISPKSELIVNNPSNFTSNPPSSRRVRVSTNYFAITIGGFFGGGRKSKN